MPTDEPDMPLTVSAFYKFVSIFDVVELRRCVAEKCREQDISGTVLIAAEGINGAVSGTAANVVAFLEWLRSDKRFVNLRTKDTATETHPFRRLKVKVKPEIVTLGLPEINPACAAGTYVPPSDWNALIKDPGVVVVDTRNAFEVGIGTFQGALDPKMRSFRDFPDFVRDRLSSGSHSKVAMFCTGGIRCEKASSYMLSQGFREVHHLEGGILNYLETVPEEQSLFRGECFVFDDRVALSATLARGLHGLCVGCGRPVALPVGQRQHTAHKLYCETCEPAR